MNAPRTYIEHGRVTRIVTDYWEKPVPSNQFDWSATSANYDADCEDGLWRGSHPIGYGSSEDAAIADFLAQVEEE